MGKKIVIIDYSLGNMFSVQQALAFVGVNAEISGDIETIKSADALVLPGVGAFSQAIDYLDSSGLSVVIKNAIDIGKPFFGICLGMQLLFENSDEFGSSKGLGIIKGSIKKFAFKATNAKVPQIGWNNIMEPLAGRWNNTILNNLSHNEFMYFVHSYYAVPTDIENILSITNYEGLRYCSAISRGNVVATQFHPEKSGKNGLKIYENWIKKI